MISNEMLAKVDTPEKLDYLFKAFGLKTNTEKIKFLKFIAHDDGASSPGMYNDKINKKNVEWEIISFLKHDWQKYEQKT